MRNVANDMWEDIEGGVFTRLPSLHSRQSNFLSSYICGYGFDLFSEHHCLVTAIGTRVIIGYHDGLVLFRV